MSKSSIQNTLAWIGVVPDGWQVVKLRQILSPFSERNHSDIRSKVYVNFFAQASDGIRVGQWDLQMDKMKEIPFIVPPADEQIQIVEYIESALPKYDDANCVLREEIRGLEELKTKLISDVITGKIDVRDVVIPDYEYVDEEVDTAETDDSEENIEEQEDE